MCQPGEQSRSAVRTGTPVLGPLQPTIVAVNAWSLVPSAQPTVAARKWTWSLRAAVGAVPLPANATANGEDGVPMPVMPPLTETIGGGPSSPFAPTGPAGPVAPVRPCGPASPAGPCGPGSPRSPFAPGSEA